jgi:hypothetical protein
MPSGNPDPDGEVNNWNESRKDVHTTEGVKAQFVFDLRSRKKLRSTKDEAGRFFALSSSKIWDVIFCELLTTYFFHVVFNSLAHQICMQNIVHFYVATYLE